ncbi:unnamed protein product [Paramecium octaurelia]|uniref:Peptidase S54 rhomboid domain-containing protein n=1 Tax=Paramecium octaurelia TaxID=43137 RepID=A0A8S1YPE6_PAROT|nr:unnamed protein product [Paramecium octaurelia]
MIKIAKLLSKSPQQLKQTYLLNHKPQFQYGQVDRFLDRLQMPLYFYLIGINVGVYALWHFPAVDKNFMYRHFTLHPGSMNIRELHTFITYSFSHQNTLHLIFNMVTFYFFGRTIEAYFGSKRLLAIYLAGALVGGLMQSRQAGISLGASAACNALLTYYICNFPREIILLFFIPVPAWIVGLLILYQGWAGQGDGSGIGHDAHLGGCLAGLAFYFATRGKI